MPTNYLTGSLRRFSYGLAVCCFAVLPLINFHSLMYNIQTSKSIFFSFIVCVLVLFYGLIALFSNRKFELRITYTDLFLALLVAFVVLNRYVFQAAYSFSMTFEDLPGLIAFYAILRQYRRNELVGLVLAVGVGAMFQVMHGDLQLYGIFPSNNSIFRTTGSFFNPGPYAGYLVSALPAALGLYLNRQALWAWKYKRQLGWLLIAIVLMIASILPATASRAAWLSALVVITILLLSDRIDRAKIASLLNSLLKKLAVVFIAFTCLAVCLVSLYLLRRSSGDGRLLIWRITLQVWQHTPFLGVGFDRFQSFYMDEQARYLKSNPGDKAAALADNVNYAFNEPLQFLTEEGLIGALIFSCAVWSLYKTPRAPRYGYLGVICIAGLSGVLIFSLFSYPTQHLPIKLNALLYLVVLVNGARRYALVFPVCSRTKRIALKSVIFCLCLGLAYYGYRNTCRKYNAYQNWKIAQEAYDLNYPIAADFYRDCYSVFHNDGNFLMWYGKSLSLSGRHWQAIRILQKAAVSKNNTFIQVALGDSYKAINQVEKAETAYWTASYMSPGKFYPKYLLFKLYMENGRKEEGRVLARELVTKKIKVNSLAIDQMKAEVKSYLAY